MRVFLSVPFLFLAACGDSGSGASNQAPMVAPATVDTASARDVAGPWAYPVTASDADGQVTTLVLSRSLDGGAWTEVLRQTGQTSAVAYDPSADGGHEVALAVMAIDDDGTASTAVEIARRQVALNQAPVLTGRSVPAGTYVAVAGDRSYLAFTFSDADGDTVTVRFLTRTPGATAWTVAGTASSGQTWESDPVSVDTEFSAQGVDAYGLATEPVEPMILTMYHAEASG